MKRKILLIRDNESRHKAFSVVLKKSGHALHEVIEIKNFQRKTPLDEITKAHFQSRQQVELDLFSDLLDETSVYNSLQLQSDDINGEEVAEFVKNLKIDLVITFGCSILRSPLLKQFRGKILGVHLGLSPYYRGSGTNFFPFVNNELGAIGYTLMSLNEGVDTGNIVHQSYAEVINGDSMHTIGTRLMQKMFNDIVKISHLDSLEFVFDSAVKQPIVLDSRFYRKQDFDRNSLELAIKNINNGAIRYFLENIEAERGKFPLINEMNLNAT